MRLPKRFFTFSSRNYIELALFFIVWIIMIRFFMEWRVIPFRFEEFLFFRGQWWEPFKIAWPVFLLGGAINLVKMMMSINPPEVQENVADIPLSGLATSLVAGVMEELAFRWVLLYGFMGMFWLLDSMIDLVLGQHLLQSLFTGELFWVNKLLTAGASGILNQPGAWTISLAALASNWKFQSGHVYQGPLGMILSWVAGVFFFVIMFGHGLLAAMLVHFAFDMMVFLMLAVDVMIENALGLRQAKKRIYQWYS